MVKDIYSVLFIPLSGLLAWSLEVYWLAPLSLVYFFLLIHTNNAKVLFCVAFAYFAVATRFVIPGATAFLDINPVASASIWLLTTILLAGICYGLALLIPKAHKALYLTALIIVMAVPPVGLIGWANPIIFAALATPVSGPLGIVVGAGVVALLAQLSLKPQLCGIAIMVVASMSTMVSFGREYNQDPVVHTVNTARGSVEAQQSSNPIGSMIEGSMLIEAAARSTPKQLLVFPESFGGILTPGALSHYQALSTKIGKSFIVGAIDASQPNTLYNNAHLFTKDGKHSKLTQAIPVPVGMYNPFAAQNFPVSYSGRTTINNSFTLEGVKLRVLICYEVFLVYPALVGPSAGDVSSLTVISSLWWADKSVINLNKTYTIAHGALLRVPATTANNYSLRGS